MQIVAQMESILSSSNSIFRGIWLMKTIASNLSFIKFNNSHSSSELQFHFDKQINHERKQLPREMTQLKNRSRSTSDSQPTRKKIVRESSSDIESTFFKTDHLSALSNWNKLSRFQGRGGGD